MLCFDAVISGDGRVVDGCDRDGECAGIGPAVAIGDGVGEGCGGVVSSGESVEIEGVDGVAAVGVDGQVNGLCLSGAIGICVGEGDGDGLSDVGGLPVDGGDVERAVEIVNIGSAGQQVAGSGVDGDAVLELIFCL